MNLSLPQPQQRRALRSNYRGIYIKHFPTIQQHDLEIWLTRQTSKPHNSIGMHFVFNSSLQGSNSNDNQCINE